MAVLRNGDGKRRKVRCRYRDVKGEGGRVTKRGARREVGCGDPGGRVHAESQGHGLHHDARLLRQSLWFYISNDIFHCKSVVRYVYENLKSRLCR